MPSIKDAVQKNAQRIAAGQDLVQPAPKDVGPKSSDGPFVSPASPVVTGLPVRGVYTPDITLHTDFQNNTGGFRSGPNLRSATFPPPQKTSSSIVSKIVTAATAAVSSLIIKVNNVLAPNQKLINLLNGTGMIITVDAAGNIVFNSTSSGDGLTHSSEPWESDPAYFILRDDFVGFTASTSAPASPAIGQLGWASLQTNGHFGNQKQYSSGNFGILTLDNGSTAANSAQSIILGTNDPVNTTTSGFPLTYIGGWQADFIFRFPTWYGAGGGTVFNIPAVESRFYIGFAAMPNTATSTSTPRPAKFIGLRYDTDPAIWTLSAAGTASGSLTVYTGTFTGAATNALAGQTFTVAGFVTHSSNNGSFLCTSNTTTTITLANASGVAESHAATATATAFSDSTFKYEFVQNLNVGSNIQGTVTANAAGLAPDYNWHRFTMRSVTAGTILFSIDGGAESSITVGTDSITAGTGSPLAGSQLFTLTQDQYSNPYQLTALTIGSGLLATGGPWAPCPGTPVTCASLAGAKNTPFNGAVLYAAECSALATFTFDSSTVASQTGSNTSATGTVTWYNCFAPYVFMGNDSEASNTQKALQIDMFSFIWNPNLSSNAPGTPDSTLARYW